MKGFRYLFLIVMLSSGSFTLLGDANSVDKRVILEKNKMVNSNNDSTSSDTLKWPRVLTISNADITLYQPQFENLTNNIFKARMAVAIKRHKSTKVDYCVVWISGKFKSNKNLRIVTPEDLKIDKINYPGTSNKVKKSLGHIISSKLSKADLSITLDRLVAMIANVDRKNKNQETHGNHKTISPTSGIKNPTPQFFYSSTPAILVYIAGAPVMRDQGNGISIVANTNFPIALDIENKKYYLYAASQWFSSEKIEGPWSGVKDVPQKIVTLGKEVIGKSVKDNIVPKVFISLKPAELIQSNGEAILSQIPGTNLSYLKNSDSDLFKDDLTSKLYLLASGRWFVADKKEGPWRYIPSKKLPEDFRKIPRDSPKHDVLSNISGTQLATEAIAENYIPQTATLKCGEISLNIKYNGKPDFKPIESTNLLYAINTDAAVLKFNDKYYACVDGAWYESSSSTGKWSVCKIIPNEIYNIPPSNPLYYTTFVRLYSYNSEDDTVETGYTPGYEGSYISDGGLVYGTGWNYNYGYYGGWNRWGWIYPVTYGRNCFYHRLKGCWYRASRYRLSNGRYIGWNSRRFNKRPVNLPIRAKGSYLNDKKMRNSHNVYKYNKSLASFIFRLTVLTKKIKFGDLFSR